MPGLGARPFLSRNTPRLEGGGATEEGGAYTRPKRQDLKRSRGQPREAGLVVVTWSATRGGRLSVCLCVCVSVCVAGRVLNATVHLHTVHTLHTQGANIRERGQGACVPPAALILFNFF